MEEVKKSLEAREKYLSQVIKEKEKAISSAPEGCLRICCRNDGKVQYYYRREVKDNNGTYIREKDFALAQNLAQKEYDQKVLRASEKEQKVIQKYLADYPQTCAEQIFEKLHPARQEMIKPIAETEEQYIQNWEAVSYERNGFDNNTPEFYTARGERVRSKSEVIIADLLYREGIPYRYEYPLKLHGYGTVYPDFMMLRVRDRKEIYLEHLGRMDDPDYVERNLQKRINYERNGIFQGDKLILTYETKKSPLNQKLLSQTILHYMS